MSDSIKDAVTMKALIEVDSLYALENRPSDKIKLNVIGGFALLLNNVRKDMTEYTDIDYIGGKLPGKLEEIIKSVGIKHGLSSDWINNDSLLEGASQEDLEITTGKLNFLPKVELNCFEVHALCNQDLLRLKMMAIDTTYMALEPGENFTRQKDFSDVKLLMEELNIDTPALIKMTSDYVLEPAVYDIVSTYNKTGEITIENTANTPPAPTNGLKDLLSPQDTKPTNILRIDPSKPIIRPKPAEPTVKPEPEKSATYNTPRVVDPNAPVLEYDEVPGGVKVRKDPDESKEKDDPFKK